MKNPSTCSRRSLVVTAILMMILTAILDLALFTVAQVAVHVTEPAQAAGALPPGFPLGVGTFIAQGFWMWVVPATVILWGLWTLMLWRYHAGMFKGLEAAGKKASKNKAGSSKSPAPDPAALKKREQRLYVHLLALMQREGRLVDFFLEDLEGYEDAQIGAAARSVHQGCRKALDRHLSLGPILDQEEESDITVPKGFDPSVMTLTGNVTGDPPFEGQVLHRGWRVKRFNLPTLSETEDASLVAPSEVDVR